jgi:hypothetical protein
MGSYDYASVLSQFKDVFQGDTLPEGEYDAKVKSVTEVTTAKGKQAFKITLEIMGGPHAGRTLLNQLTFSPESDIAVRIFGQSMATLGASPDWIMSNRATGAMIIEKITGTTVRIQNSHREFNGQPRNEVRYLRRLEGLPQSVPAVGGTDWTPKQVWS